jgi:hypothetical protein
MRLFLRTLWFTLPFFLSLLINLIQAIITNNNPGNHRSLLIITHYICNAHKMVVPELNHSKKTIPHKIFYEKGNWSSGQITNIKKAL